MGWNPFKAAYNAVSTTVGAAVTAVATVTDTVAMEVFGAKAGLAEGIDYLAGSDIAGKRDAVQGAISGAAVATYDQVVGTEKAVLDEEGNAVLNEDGSPQVTHGWIHDTAAPAIAGAAVSLTKAETYKTAWTETKNFGEYAWNNPGRAGALALQGVVNAGSSTVGMIGDLGQGLVRAGAAAVYNVGLSEGDEKMAYVKESGLLGYSTALTETLQIRNIPWENETFQNAFGEIKDEIIVSYIDAMDMAETIEDENGNTIDNPTYGEIVQVAITEPNKNANYERVLLYGPQAAAEIGIVLVGSAFTAGAVGAAYGAARSTVAVAARSAAYLTRGTNVASRLTKASQLTARTTSAFRRADAVADAVNSGTKLAKLEANGVTTGSKLTKATAQAERGAARLISGGNGRVAVKELVQEDLLQHTARVGKKLIDQIADAQKIVDNAASSARAVTKAEAQIAKAEVKLTEIIEKTNLIATRNGLAPVTMEAAKAAEVATVTMNSAQYIANTAGNFSSRTYRFMHPLRDKMSAGIEVGAALGVTTLSVYAQEKAAEAKYNGATDATRDNINAFIGGAEQTSDTSGQFNDQSGAGNQGDPSDIQTGHDINTQFGNRTSGNVVIPNTAFSVDVQVTPEEAKVLEKTLGGN